jgi:DNA-binding beta-propeller fold protein YncE
MMKRSIKNIVVEKWLGSVMLFLAMTLLLWSCDDKDFGERVASDEFLLEQNGFLVVNEGNYTHSNGSVSFYSFDSMKVYHHVFFNENQRPIGDVPYHLTFADTLCLITVNNSAKIEVAGKSTLSSLSAIQTGSSPRKTLVVNPQKAYVSDLYSDSLTVINPQERTVNKRIFLGRSSEDMILSGNKLFVANWSMYAHPETENNKVMVLDAFSDRVVDSIEVVKEPNSMVPDKNGDLWVLSSGGFMNETLPALQRINSETAEVEETFYFPDKESSPDNLTMNQTGDTLYFLNRGVFAMGIAALQLPQHPAIEEDGRMFYSLGMAHGHIIVSDAADYQQRGMVYVYNKSFDLTDAFRAGIIPGQFVAVKP